MTDEKTGPVCAHCGKRKPAHLSLWWCSNVRSSFFTPAEPEAKEATDADFELRATCPHGFSYIEDCDRCPWSPEAKEVEPTDRAWMRAAIKTLQSDRDAAIERAESMLTRLRKAIGGDIDWTTRDCLDVFRDRLAQLAAVTAERDRMRPVVKAARFWMKAHRKLRGVTLNGTEWEHDLIRAIDAFDAAKPVEPTPAQCSGKCKWDDGASEGPGYFYGDADCPVHGVERPGRSDNTSTAMMGDGIDVPGKAASTAAPERVSASVAPAGKETGRLPAFAGFSGEAKRNPRAERPGYSSLSCLLCGVPVADLHTDSCGPGSFTTSGVIWRTAGNYGSAVFDSFDGLQLLAGMCDVCLTAKQGAILGAQKVAIEPHERWLYMAGEVAIRGDDIVPPGVPNDLNDWLGSTCGLLGIRGGDMGAIAAEIASWDAEPTPLPAERCHCGQHSMERPDIHGINWYWSKHTREACTLELPNARCWCGRLRSEHIDGHAAPIIPPAVDPRDAADEWTDAKCDSYKTTTSSWGRYAMDAIKRRNARIAELEEKLVAADVYGVELARRIGERGARIAELETILASTRETWNEQVQELEIDRDQQRARADAAEARCGEVAWSQALSIARGFRGGQHAEEIAVMPLVTDAKEKSK